jgi:hypothetical protein
VKQRFINWRRIAVVPIVIGICAPHVVQAKPQAAAELQAEYERLTAEAVKSDPGWRPKQPATGSIVFVAPDQYSGGAESSGPVDDARRVRADALFDLAKRAAEADQLSLAYQWTTEAVRENPDHVDARRVLGYEQHKGQWLTAYAKRMVDVGKVWDPRFGWIAAENVSRYEKGERLVGQQWVTAEVDAARRTKMEDGWQVRTDHFLVTSNKSLEAAAEMAARLEGLHQVWQQLFAGYWSSEQEVKGLFAGERLARERHQPFHVYYHRDREDYNNSLKREQPRVVETMGIYFDTLHQAHFFAGADQDAGTIYHETVHELFQESRLGAKRAAEKANFWLIEGIATYFETMNEHRDPQAGLCYTIGQSSKGRLPAARERLLKDHQYIPLAQLTKWGRVDMQAQPNLARVYSEASGMAAFLMDAEHAKYREPLVQYLQAVYAGHDDPQTLSKLTGRSYPELDGEYRQFMESLP